MNNDQHAPAPRSAEFRLYAELNDFLADDHRGRSFVQHFKGTPSVKNVIEAFDSFTRCAECGRVYWQGSHFDRMSRLVGELRESAGER